MERFEYRTYVYDTKGLWGGQVDDQFQSELNRLGSDGWELVSGVTTNQTQGVTRSIVCIFKRQKR